MESTIEYKWLNKYYHRCVGMQKRVGQRQVIEIAIKAPLTCAKYINRSLIACHSVPPANVGSICNNLNVHN